MTQASLRSLHWLADMGATLFYPDRGQYTWSKCSSSRTGHLRWIQNRIAVDQVQCPKVRNCAKKLVGEAPSPNEQHGSINAS